MYRSQKRNAWIGVMLAVLLVLMIPVVGVRVLLAKDDVSSSAVTRATGQYGKVTTRGGQTLYDNGLVYYPTVMAATIGEVESGLNTILLNRYRTLMAPSFSALIGIKGASGGRTLATTLLAPDELQAVADAFRGKGGAVAAYNYESGEVLCLLSVDGETTFGGNRCLTGLYIPGSTMKVVSCLAAIEQNPDFFDDFTATCTGSATLPGNIKVDCTGEHPECDGAMLLGRSCNIATATVASLLDPAQTKQFLTQVGFELDVDKRFYYESGDVFTKSRSSVVYKGDRGYTDIWSLVGQGEAQISMLDMLQIAGAVANKGKAAEPYLVQALYNDSGRRLKKWKSDGKTELFSAKTAKVMDKLWTEAYDTYYTDGIQKLDECYSYAKTGTAQIGNGKQNRLLLGVSKEHKVAFMIVVEDHKPGDPFPNEIANVLANYLPED